MTLSIKGTPRIGVSGLQLPFCPSRLPAPAAIIRHFIPLGRAGRGALRVTGSPAESADIGLRPSVTLPGSGLPCKTVDLHPDSKLPGDAKFALVATSNTRRALEVTERIVSNSEGQIRVPWTRS